MVILVGMLHGASSKSDISGPILPIRTVPRCGARGCRAATTLQRVGIQLV